MLFVIHFIVQKLRTYVMTNVTGIKMNRLNGSTCSFPYAIFVWSSSMLQDTIAFILRYCNIIRCVLYSHLDIFLIGLIKSADDLVIDGLNNEKRRVSGWTIERKVDVTYG